MKNTIRFFFLATLLASCVSTTGVVQGKLCFPSENVPAMNVYLKTVGADKVYKLVSKDNQQAFTFKKIPEGNYVAFAYTVETTSLDLNNKKSKASGGVQHFVSSGFFLVCSEY